MLREFTTWTVILLLVVTLTPEQVDRMSDTAIQRWQSGEPLDVPQAVYAEWLTAQRPPLANGGSGAGR